MIVRVSTKASCGHQVTVNAYADNLADLQWAKAEAKKQLCSRCQKAVRAAIESEQTRKR